MKSKIVLVLAAMAFFVGFASYNLEAQENQDQSLNVVAVIGDKEFVVLSRHTLTGTISAGNADTLIGTEGSDEVFLGIVECNIYCSYSTQSSAGDQLQLYEYEYDAANSNFSLLHQLNQSDRLYLDIRSNMSVAGALQQPASVGTNNPIALRTGMQTSSVVDEVFQLSFWVLDDVNNATTSGRYVGTFVFFFTD